MIKITFILLLLSSFEVFSAQSFGEKINKDNMLSIKTVIDANSTYLGKDLVVRGKVDRLCVKKGCWLNLGDNKDFVRVTFKNYGIFVPSNFLGKEVAVKGVFDIKEESVKRRKHLMEDEGLSRDEINKVKKPIKTYSFVASGIELI